MNIVEKQEGEIIPEVEVVDKVEIGQNTSEQELTDDEILALFDDKVNEVTSVLASGENKSKEFGKMAPKVIKDQFGKIKDVIFPICHIVGCDIAINEKANSKGNFEGYNMPRLIIIFESIKANINEIPTRHLLTLQVNDPEFTTTSNGKVNETGLFSVKRDTKVLVHILEKVGVTDAELALLDKDIANKTLIKLYKEGIINQSKELTGTRQDKLITEHKVKFEIIKAAILKRLKKPIQKGQKETDVNGNSLANKVFRIHLVAKYDETEFDVYASASNANFLELVNPSVINTVFDPKKKYELLPDDKKSKSNNNKGLPMDSYNERQNEGSAIIGVQNIQDLLKGI